MPPNSRFVPFGPRQVRVHVKPVALAKKMGTGAKKSCIPVGFLEKVLRGRARRGYGTDFPVRSPR